MPRFQDIIGHNQIISHLKNAIRMNKVSHAYILNGEKNAGKMMLAEAFAQTLQCEYGKSSIYKKIEKEHLESVFLGTTLQMQFIDPCMECRSCIQAQNHNHPDIIYVRHEKQNVISVEDIRSQLNNDIIIKPYNSKYKIYIIDEAEKLNIQAQNALLKTIEEPPSYAVILLLTTNADGFLPTILSRCITLHLKGVNEEEITAYLMKKYQIPDYQAEMCAAFSQGNVGKAIQLASSEDFNKLKADAVQLMKKLENMDVCDINQVVKQISTLYKANMEDYFDLLTIWFRDILYMKSTKDVNHIIFRDEIYDIKKQAEKYSYFEIETILNALKKAKAQLKANVNFDLVVELLLFTIKENEKL